MSADLWTGTACAATAEGRHRPSPEDIPTLSGTTQ